MIQDQVTASFSVFHFYSPGTYITHHTLNQGTVGDKCYWEEFSYDFILSLAMALGFHALKLQKEAVENSRLN